MTDDTLVLIQQLQKQGMSNDEVIDELDKRRACECCDGAVGLRKAGVAAIPGVPISILWCAECIKAQIVPVWVAVAQTAMVGGYDNLAPPYRMLVDDTIEYFNMPPLQFHWAVACAIRDYEEVEEQALAAEQEGQEP